MKRLLCVLLGVMLCVSMLSGCRLAIKKGIEFAYDMADRYSVGDAEIEDTIKKIEINWVSGNIHVIGEKRDTIAISETANKTLKDELRMRYLVSDQTLTIQFCISGKINVNAEDFDLNKDLTIYVPEDLELSMLQIGTVSADVEVKGVECEKLLVAGISADTDIRDTIIEESLRIETVSGSLNYCCKNKQIPETINMDSVSGNATIKLFKDASVDVKFNSVGGNFTTELPDYEGGDVKITIDSVSGNLEILK